MLDASTLPAAWQPLKTNPNPVLKVGDSRCYISNLQTGLGVSITIYRGPGRGIDELSKTVGPPLSAIVIAGHNGRLYHDTAGNTCGVLLDVGPDQGLIVAAIPPVNSPDDPCVILTTAVTAMDPNLPPA